VGVDDAAVEHLLELVARRRGVDFRDHRRAAIERGIAARLRANGISEIAEYADRLAHDDAETDRLIEALVVPVSSFFRDREVFDALEKSVIPDQLARTAGPLRTWVAGVATGEEAWSWAMLMAWCREMLGGPPIEVLGTDVDERSLAVARAGRYPAASANEVPQRFRSRFLDPGGDAMVVPHELRNHVHFAQHDLVGPVLAPPEAILASFQIISFRNVLIYLDQRLRRKALERLRAILKPEGVLVLGLVETLPADLEASFVPYPGTEAPLHIFKRSR
jgi:two-component system, chemotaxis family, CheB/CheR fusion protein